MLFHPTRLLLLALITFATVQARSVELAIDFGAPFQVDHLFDENDQDHAAIAMMRDGQFLVVWHSDDELEANPDLNIRGRLFNSGGFPIGDEFLISPISEDRQHFPSVATDGSHRYVVAWSAGSNAEGFLPYFRILGPAGQLLGDPILISDTISEERVYPDVAMTPDGNIVVTWLRIRNGNQQVFARAFDPNGHPLWEARRLNLTGNNDPEAFALPDIDASANGWAVAAWSYRNRQQGSAIAFTDFSVLEGPPASPRSEQFIGFNDPGGPLAQRPSVSMNDAGKFVIGWVKVRRGTHDIACARTFDPFTIPISPIIELEPLIPRTKRHVVVEQFSNGSFVALYTQEGNQPNTSDIILTGYSEAGQLQIPPTLLNQGLRDTFQVRPSVSASGEIGEISLGVTWESRGRRLTGTGKSIVAKLLLLFSR